MALFVLIAGLALWTLAHLVKRLFPGLRRDLGSVLGETGARAVMALFIAAGLVMIVLGFRGAALPDLYDPPPWGGYATDILMLVAIFFMGIGPAGGRLSARFRHPMLTGVVIWAVAHLLANGDGASVILFGWLGLWALFEMRLINAHEGPWERPLPGESLQDMKLALATLFIFLVTAVIHWILGGNVFLGDY